MKVEMIDTSIIDQRENKHRTIEEQATSEDKILSQEMLEYCGMQGFTSGHADRRVT
jgi:hypothetical protein